MDVLTLSRLQFAATTLFHYIFVPLTLGLPLMIAVMQTRYLQTGDEIFKSMAKFWGKLFLINFAMGVVTGIVQEFQFGMNWSEYSRFVGDIFGAPLAVEALMAFFLESTFLGVWIFGWDKLPKRVHLASIWIVAIAVNLSAFWILTANSFMQYPVGYQIGETGRLEMTNFFALLTNPNLWIQFPHVVLGGIATGAFFVIGVSAYRMLYPRSEQDAALFGRSMRIGLWFGLSSIMFTMAAGHAHGQFLAEANPMKLAAAEALWESEDPAALSLFQIGDMEHRTEIINIKIPSLLSFLSYNMPDGMVQGLNPLNERYQEQYGEGNYIPFVMITYWSFRAMVGAGTLMSLLAILGLFLDWRGKLATSPWVLTALVVSLLLPYLANATGWMLTELGRQPWIVHGLMTVDEAVSPNLTVTSALISLVGFTLLYSVLLVADVYLLWKYGTSGDSNGEILPQPTADDDYALVGAFGGD